MQVQLPNFGRSDVLFFHIRLYSPNRFWESKILSKATSYSLLWVGKPHSICPSEASSTKTKPVSSFGSSHSCRSNRFHRKLSMKFYTNWTRMMFCFHRLTNEHFRYTIRSETTPMFVVSVSHQVEPLKKTFGPKDKRRVFLFFENVHQNVSNALTKDLPDNASMHVRNGFEWISGILNREEKTIVCRAKVEKRTREISDQKVK